MEKPNARGPSPSRKAHLALGQKLNRKEKQPPQNARSSQKNRARAPGKVDR